MAKKVSSHKKVDTSSDLAHIRHSASHILAEAVLRLYPDTKPALGPPIEDGFYYDFDFASPISESDLTKIEKEMKKILKEGRVFEMRELSSDETKKATKDNPYKTEILGGEVAKAKSTKKDDLVSFCYSLPPKNDEGAFKDLCKGGHVHGSDEIGAVKLLKLAGAYWRGDEKNKMLTRIYGTAFATEDELEQHLVMLEEAKKRDHKVVGPKLDIFMFHETSPGMPYWLPYGVTIYNELVNFWREEHRVRGYHEIVSPLLNKKELYETSGHYEHYWPDMFVAKTEDGEEYGVKAMNCPNAMVVFGSRSRSYRDLPLRLSDTDTLHRNELSGTLNGLLRVREFRQDDAHIFITEDGIESEYQNVFEIVERFYSIFDLEYSFRLGTRPESFMGDVETWNKAESALRNILETSGKAFTIEEGDGAFYGPKIDILMKDVLGRPWQMGTIQLDFQQPRRFSLEYTDADGNKKTPVAIHRVIYGSLERFIGILIEHFNGAFPLWLAPVQAKIMTINHEYAEYAEKVYQELLSAGIRAEIDVRNESIGKKIREAEMMKTPYMLVIGAKEAEAGHVAVRSRTKDDLGAMEVKKFIKLAHDEISSKR